MSEKLTTEIKLKNCTSSEFEKVFKNYYRQLYAFTYAYVMNENEADDIVQETFSKIWEIRNKLPEDLNIKSYLYSSVKHACIRYFQRLKLTDEYKRKQAEALILSYADQQETDEELKTLVTQALNKLSDQQKKIVDMHINQDMKYHEIATTLSLSENTVKTHIKRAYKILRENLSFIIPGIFII